MGITYNAQLFAVLFSAYPEQTRNNSQNGASEWLEEIRGSLKVSDRLAFKSHSYDALH